MPIAFRLSDARRRPLLTTRSATGTRAERLIAGCGRWLSDSTWSATPERVVLAASVTTREVPPCRRLADVETQVFVSTDEQGRITGFAALRVDELLHFGTAVDLWGTGLARELHDALLAAFPTWTCPSPAPRLHREPSR